MGRKSKVEASVKVKTVEDIINGVISKSRAASEIGIDSAEIRHIANNPQTENR